MSEHPRLTVERLFSDPPVVLMPPQRLRFSPDGAWLAWLQPTFNQRGRLDLWIADTAAGSARALLQSGARKTQALSAADRERLERQRQFAAGVTTFEWFPDSSSLLVPMGNAIFVVALDGTSSSITPETEDPGDLRLSPQGTYMTWVTSGDLWIQRLDSRQAIRVTTGGSDVITHGLAEFIAQEEMHRFEGYWWAPDETRLVYTRVDSSGIPETHRLEVVADEVKAVSQRYPLAGGANARVTLHEYIVATGETRELVTGKGDEDYLARIGFVGSVLTLQVQRRNQQWLQLRGQSDNGDFTPWLTETSSTWINLHDNLRSLPNNRFLWTSERDGLSALMTGECGVPESERRCSPANLHITSVLATTANSALVQGWQGDPAERHLFRIRLDNGETQKLTTQPGWHDGVLHKGSNRYAFVFSNTSTLPELRMQDLGTGDVQLISAAPIDHPAHSFLPPLPVFGSLQAEDGQALYWRVTPPLNPVAGRKYPVIVYVYGGPGAQKVCNATVPGLVTLFTHAGYGVLELDNRGSANRGRSFEAPLFHHMGGIEVRDQVRGIEVLHNFPWAHADRVGIFGHSYGGFMALMCISRHPEFFRAAAAVAPVSDWKLYDTHYTERYLGNPAEDEAPYERSSVVPHLSQLQRPLLLVHGMADDNVLVTHTTKVMRELQKHGRSFDLMLYPGSRHALQEKDVSIHRFTQMLEFFGKHL
ncbi:MAG: alpha/beta fold hydrolase [Gammaproteobacteria bacterium]|nr:alpha/beta fold hydrolase [Gammaproteobacteria bacterium]